MTTRSRANFEGRSSRYANSGSNSEYDQLRQAFLEPVLKWQRKVENPSNIKTFKVPLWVNTEVQAEFDRQPSPPHSPTPETIQTGTLDEGQANVSQILTDSALSIEVPTIAVDNEEQATSKSDASDEKVEASAVETVQKSDFNEKEMSEPRELPVEDQLTNTSLETKTTAGANIITNANEVEIHNESNLVEKTAEISIEGDTRMDIDTEQAKDISQGDKMIDEAEQPKDIYQENKMDIDEIASALEPKEVSNQIQNELAQDDQMDIDPIPVTSQVENISKDEPLDQKIDNNTILETHIPEQHESQTVNAPEISQSHQMDIDKEPKLEKQIQPSEEHHTPPTIDQESTSASEPESQNNSELEQNTQEVPESIAQSDFEVESNIEIVAEADKPEVETSLSPVPAGQTKDTQKSSESAQNTNESEPEKLTESTLEATETLLSDFGTFPQPEPIDYSGAHSTQNDINETNTSSVTKTESVQESGQEVEQVNPEKNLETCKIAWGELKENSEQSGGTSFGDRINSQATTIFNAANKEPLADTNKAPLLGLVSEYQSSSPTSESESAQVGQNLDVPIESAETSPRNSKAEELLAVDEHKDQQNEPSESSVEPDPIDTTQPSIPNQQEQTNTAEASDQEQSAPEHPTHQEESSQVETSEPSQNTDTKPQN